MDQRLTIRLVSANGKKGFPLGGIRGCHSGHVLFRGPRAGRSAIGPGADSGEKREPVGDIDIAVVDSLEVLDPRRPIREADIGNPLHPD